MSASISRSDSMAAGLEGPRTSASRFGRCRARIVRASSGRLLVGWRVGTIGHEWDSRMMSPSFATALLAVDFTVPFDNPVASAISASDSPP